jgi:hypothetical protein
VSLSCLPVYPRNSTSTQLAHIAYVYTTNLAISSKPDPTYAQPAHTQPTWPYPTHAQPTSLSSRSDAACAQPTHTQPTWPYPRDSTQLARSLRTGSQLGHTLEIRPNLRVACAYVVNLAIVSSKFHLTYAQPTYSHCRNYTLVKNRLAY